MKDLLEKLSSGEDMDPVDVAAFCAHLFDEKRPVDARADLLAALSRKGETPQEIAGFVRVLLQHSRPIGIPESGAPLMDVCGTGGDRQGLFNISTAVMFVAAACGARVVKHGNHGVTSKCGGADVLEALGVRIDLEPEMAARVLEDVGCVFLFAQKFHPIFKSVAPVRKRLAERGIPSIFNKLGPLLNPANPPFQLAGVYDPAMVSVYGEALAELGRKSAWAVHGRANSGGLDEMSTLGQTMVREVKLGAVGRSFELNAEDFGLAKAELAELSGGDAVRNANILESLLRGRRPGAIEDIVVWNAAGALVVAGITESVGDAVEIASRAVHSGEAAARLDALRGSRAFRS